MKKLITLITIAALMVPLAAQSDPEFYLSEKVSLTSTVIAKENLPQALFSLVNSRFDKDNPQTWSKVPYKIKDYGWVYEVGNTELPLTNYEVNVKTTRGDSYWAAYNADGNLTQTRQISKNIALPRYIVDAFVESPYKDWHIVGNKEIINFFTGDGNAVATANQNFRITVEKDKVKKNIGFKYEEKAGKFQSYLIK